MDICGYMDDICGYMYIIYIYIYIYGYTMCIDKLGLLNTSLLEWIKHRNYLYKVWNEWVINRVTKQLQKINMLCKCATSIYMHCFWLPDIHGVQCVIVSVSDSERWSVLWRILERDRPGDASGLQLSFRPDTQKYKTRMTVVNISILLHRVIFQKCCLENMISFFLDLQCIDWDH